MLQQGADLAVRKLKLETDGSKWQNEQPVDPLKNGGQTILFFLGVGRIFQERLLLGVRDGKWDVFSFDIQ